VRPWARWREMREGNVQGKRFTPRYKFRAQPFYTTQKLCDASCRRPQRTAGCADANPSSPESLSEQAYFRMSVSRVEIHAGGKVSVWRMRASSSEHLRHESSPSRVAVWDDDRSFLRDEQTRCRALLIETVRAVRMREEAVRCLSPQRWRTSDAAPPCPTKRALPATAHDRTI
jgi:hypothetical protein